MIAKSIERPGRNEPCPCGSGKKYKQCCLDKDEKAASAARAEAAAKVDTPDAAVEDTSAKPKRPPKAETNQPWRATTNRGYIPRARTPRKVGGS